MLAVSSSLGGQTLDPYDVLRDPGGSSGGTAVAVAANFAAVGLGTDTCGSVRLPAAHNAIYGLRPTSGLSSRAGVIPFSPTLDEVGPMARTIVDLAILLEATAGVDPADPTTVPGDHDYLAAITARWARRPAHRRPGVRPRTVRSATRWMPPSTSSRRTGRRWSRSTCPRVTMTDAPWFDELGPALESYLAAQPNAPVRSLAEVLAQEPYVAGVTWALYGAAEAGAIDEARLERAAAATVRVA